VQALVRLAASKTTFARTQGHDKIAPSSFALAPGLGDPAWSGGRIGTITLGSGYFRKA